MQNFVFWGRNYMQVVLYLYFIWREIVLNLDKNYTLFENLAVPTLLRVSFVIKYHRYMNCIFFSLDAYILIIECANLK